MKANLMMLVQDIINDEDLDSISIKEFRSVLLHVQQHVEPSAHDSDIDDLDDDELSRRFVL